MYRYYYFMYVVIIARLVLSLSFSPLYSFQHSIVPITFVPFLSTLIWLDPFSPAWLDAIKHSGSLVQKSLVTLFQYAIIVIIYIQSVGGHSRICHLTLITHKLVSSMTPVIAPKMIEKRISNGLNSLTSSYFLVHIHTHTYTHTHFFEY